MSDRLYYTDSYLAAFESPVFAIDDVDGRPAVRLAQSCFYPTSGGQLHDTGTLGGMAVVDVVAADDGVLHVLDGAPAFGVGDVVHGAIDWTRRYDHMQQHSGQHLLSQHFFRHFGWETVSVHFGAEESTLDLDTPDVSPAQLAEIEGLANELAYRALPIRAYFVDEAGLAAVPLRRPPKVTGVIRIVEIEAFDYSACGGTHVRTTAEIAPIKLVRQERRRNQTRVTFLCGLRACRDYSRKHDLLLATAALFSNEPAAVPSLVERLQEQSRAAERELGLLGEQLAGYEAAELLAHGTVVNGATLVAWLSAQHSPDALKAVAARLSAHPATIGLLAGTAGDKVTVIFCRSADLNMHMGTLLRDTLRAFGGGGGGRPEHAQGGGIAPELAQAALDHASGLVLEQKKD
ncbi:MAG: DHHA1 domain-containing protein [Caldilinea sp.]|nr:DHHA1 domain-containing protein [Caldilinea sp.]